MVVMDCPITLNNHLYIQHNVQTLIFIIILLKLHIVNILYDFNMFLNGFPNIKKLLHLIILINAIIMNIFTGGFYYKYFLLIHYIAPSLILLK